MPDHHTDVSFAEFVRCADAFSPGPSVGSLEDRSLGALWHACLLLDGVACMSELSQYFDTDTRVRVARDRGLASGFRDLLIYT